MTPARDAPSFLDELPRAREAYELARDLHRGQTRAADRAPFILHPLEAACLLFTTGHPEDLIVAAILHDSVEKSEAEVQDIAARFGEHAAGIVAAMTEDPSAPQEIRHERLRRQVEEYGDGAIAVYAADKISKVRELRAEAARDADLLDDGGGARERLDHYIASLRLLEGESPGHPLVAQLRFELEALEMLPPGATGSDPGARAA